MKISRNVFVIATWFFVVGVMVQVFFAGMTVVAGEWSWMNHVTLGHALSLPLMVMMVTAFTGKFPASIKRQTLLLFGIYILQADVLIFLRASAPVLSALHPVLALVDFALGLWLAVRARAIQKEPLTMITAEVA